MEKYKVCFILYILIMHRAAVCAFKFLQVKPHGELTLGRLQNWVKIIGEPFEMQV